MSIIQRNHSVSCYEFRDGDRSGEPAARSAGPLIDSYPTGGNELKGALTVKPLFKTVVVLWTESDPSKSDFQLMDLPILAEQEYVWCSSMKSVRVADPSKDREWNDIDFWNE
jgi:hypothetical protein